MALASLLGLAAAAGRGRAVAGVPGIASARQDGEEVVVEVRSGTYAFAYPSTGLTLPAASLPAPTQP